MTLTILMIIKMKMMVMIMMFYDKCHLKTKKPTLRDFKPFNFLVQQHENIEQSKNKAKTIQPKIYSMVGFISSLK